jgi:hypothetical protein
VGEFFAGTELDDKPLENTGDVFEDLIVPEANAAPSLGLEPCCAPRVLLFSPAVLATIDLDDEQSFEANKIGDVRAKWDLSAEATSS